MALSPETRDKLKRVSPATLATALYKRGFRNQFIGGIKLLNPDAPRLVGPAYTMRYIPAREDLDHIGVFEDRSHPQRKGVEECPPGAVFVIDSRNDAKAAAREVMQSRSPELGTSAVPASSASSASSSDSTRSDSTSK